MRRNKTIPIAAAVWIIIGAVSFINVTAASVIALVFSAIGIHAVAEWADHMIDRPEPFEMPPKLEARHERR